MIVIKIELWPKGDSSKARTLGRATISNDITGTNSKGNYRVRLFGWRGRRLWKEGEVTGFPRTRLGAFDLLYRALSNTVGGRK